MRFDSECPCYITARSEHMRPHAHSTAISGLGWMGAVKAVDDDFKTYLLDAVLFSCSRKTEPGLTNV